MAPARGTPRFTPAASLSLCASPAPRAEGPAPLAPPPHTSARLLPASLRKQKGTLRKPKGEERSAKAPLPGRPSFTANSSSPVLGPLKLPPKVLSSKSLIKATTDPTRGVSHFIVMIPLGWRRGRRRGGGAFLNRTCMFQLIRSPPRPLPRCPRSPRGCHARSQLHLPRIVASHLGAAILTFLPCYPFPSKNQCK